MFMITDVVVTASPLYVPVGVDLAKDKIQVAYKDVTSKRKVNRKMKRTEFMDFLCNSQFHMEIGIEACGSCHYWARVAQAQGHHVKIFQAKMTNTFNTGNKDDHNDAYILWQLVQTPDVNSVRIREEKEQVLQGLISTRELLIKEKTQLLNALRAVNYELGEVCNKGSREQINQATKRLIEANKGKVWSECYILTTSVYSACIDKIEEQLKTIEKYISSYVRKDQICKIIQTIPGFGEIVSFTLSVTMGEPNNFANARAFADYCGVAPYHTGTGGKVNILGVSRNGRASVKRVIYQSGLAAYRHFMKLHKKDPISVKDSWIFNLSGRKTFKQLICAICNKLCRTAWATAKNNQAFDSNISTLFSAGKQKRLLETRTDSL